MSLEFNLVLVGAGKDGLVLFGMDGQLLAGKRREVMVPFEAEVIFIVDGLEGGVLLDVTAPLGEDDAGRDGVEGQQLAESALAHGREEEEYEVSGQFVPGDVGRSVESGR